MPSRLAFTASSAPAAQEAFTLLTARYGNVAEDDADIVVALGGDGLMLDVLHRLLRLDRRPAIYGMNRGTTGFLLNGYQGEGLEERLGTAVSSRVVPLECRAWSVAGDELPLMRAFNEVALRRLSNQ